MILAFFAGHALFAWASRRQGPLGKLSWVLVLSVPVIVAAGVAAQRAGLMGGRAIGLTVLGLISLSLPLAARGLVTARASRG